MLKRFYVLFTITCIACTEQERAPEISFYHWKSVFNLNSAELACLEDNHCKTIYIRYFDIVKKDSEIKPEASVELKFVPANVSIIPVVFIKNNVFENTDSVAINKLALNTLSFIDQINSTYKIKCNELQLDCDWTERTKNNFFCFTRRIKTISRKTISSTIRLHQVKYKKITGIPPVDKGVLMYYNMGEINSRKLNSIYIKSIADKYINSIADYPLPLNIALPVFSWGIQTRNDKVVELLNKLNEGDLMTDTNFYQISNAGFMVKHPCFKGGYYFMKDDEIKMEFVKQEELLEMADDLRSHLDKPVGSVIFYDMDSVNLTRYEKGIYKKVLDRFN